MLKLRCLLMVWALYAGVLCERENNEDFVVKPLDFSSFQTGKSALASNPVTKAILKADKSHYPYLFDTVVSSSIDSLNTRLAPKDNTFSPERFGFNPIASQGFHAPVKSAKLVAPKKPSHQPFDPNEKSGQLYDIRTVHDANYKIYNPEENDNGEILATLKRNPSVASYFQPATTNIEVAHPIKYRSDDVSGSSESIDQYYKPNTYITGSSRIRRYSDGGKSQRQRKSSQEEEEDGEEPYDYKSEYVSRPKAFDSDAYRSPYKEEKDPNKDYEYPYDYDSGYDHKEYERIKELSEKQAAEIKQNPGNCNEVLKDGMKCVTCKDPKTGGNYESCSYVTEPKNNKYAYSKERKFDSNDEPDGAEGESKDKSPNNQREESDEDTESRKRSRDSSEESKEPSTRNNNYNDGNDPGSYNKGYYVHSSRPKPSAALVASNDEDSEEKSDTLSKPYNYQKAIPGFYSDNEPKKDVEHVLAEFKKKDRSSCKRVQKNGMTCYQCIDKSGLKNEECMFVSESAPKRSHLAYQELKEFTSKPPTLGNDGAESKIVTTSAPLPASKSAAYVVANSGYGKKLKRKKAVPIVASASTTFGQTSVPVNIPIQSSFPSIKTKRNAESEDSDEPSSIVDETNIAPPEEFAGADSRGAFWAETLPRYSATLGVSLPQYMLSRSEHEASFDETVAGA